MKYLAGYPESLKAQVRQILAQGRLGELLLAKYRQAHGVRTDKALFDYVMALKNDFLRNAEPLAKVVFDSKRRAITHALGSRLKSKCEVKRSTAVSRMIAVHQQAQLKEKAHDKAFYQLCHHMEPHYQQLEFDVRMYLTHLDASGEHLWGCDFSPLRA